MKISELIERLEKEKSEHGDLYVTVYADHGQSNESAHHITIQLVDEDGECYDEDDITDFEGLTKVIEIAS